MVRLSFFILFLFSADVFANEANSEQLYQVFEEVVRPYRKEIREVFDLDIQLFPQSNNSSIGRLDLTDNLIKLELKRGLTRSPYFTKDSLAMIYCHEIGHLIGGVPAENNDIFGLPLVFSTEGQSDYFAALICMKQYLKNKDNAAYLKGRLVNKKVEKECSQIYSQQSEKLICLRTALAGREFIDLITSNGWDFSEEDLAEYSFATPNPFVLENSDIPFLGYPDHQCRLDTLLAGALCSKEPLNKKMSYSSYTKGVCSRGKGKRPLCWFNPRQEYIYSD